MSPMEKVIIVVGLLSACGGALVLLSCLAGKRAQLFRVFELQQEMLAQEKEIEERLALSRGRKQSPGDPATEDADPAEMLTVGN